ncbi:MAG: hypothetical protein OJF50_002485 [Nitrospira sp.]|nr:hypothetical protein [Nitrospira sp.]
MSELRKRCFELMKSRINGTLDSTYVNDLDALEAFAKQEQIKGMEAVKELTHTHHAPFHWYFEWLRKKIDAAIKQLKDGG